MWRRGILGYAQLLRARSYLRNSVPCYLLGRLRPASRRAAPSAHRLPAPPPQHAHAAHTGYRPTRTDSRPGQYSCAAARNRRPTAARTLGGRLIKGANNASSVGVLVERTSRLVLLAKMEDATAASALAGFFTKLNAIVEPLRQSFTYDQGKKNRSRSSPPHSLRER